VGERHGTRDTKARELPPLRWRKVEALQKVHSIYSIEYASFPKREMYAYGIVP
jgi:hypothetical protein